MFIFIFFCANYFFWFVYFYYMSPPFRHKAAFLYAMCRIACPIAPKLTRIYIKECADFHKLIRSKFTRRVLVNTFIKCSSSNPCLFRDCRYHNALLLEVFRYRQGHIIRRRHFLTSFRFVCYETIIIHVLYIIK